MDLESEFHKFVKHKKNLDQQLKTREMNKTLKNSVDINKELDEVTMFFKKRIPMVKDIVNLIVKFKQANKKKSMSEQVKIWNELLTKFVIFDLDADLAGEHMRRISEELVHEANTLHMKGEVFDDILQKSELL